MFKSRYLKVIVVVMLIGLFQVTAFATTYWEFPTGGCVINHRDCWDADDPSGSITSRNMSNDDYVIFHHSAGLDTGYSDLQDVYDKIKSIQDAHMSAPNDWSDIGYHYLIDNVGRIFAGRDIDSQGAHTLSYNDNVGICLLGNYEGLWGIGARTLTSSVLLSMKKLAAYQMYLDDLDLSGVVKGHKDFDSNTLCPGRNVYPSLSDVQDYLDANMVEE